MSGLSAKDRSTTKEPERTPLFTFPAGIPPAASPPFRPRCASGAPPAPPLAVPARACGSIPASFYKKRTCHALRDKLFFYVSGGNRTHIRRLGERRYIRKTAKGRAFQCLCFSCHPICHPIYSLFQIMTHYHLFLLRLHYHSVLKEYCIGH